MWLGSVVILCILTRCLCNPLQPARILVATVIDPTSSEVVRDSLTLLRSIRLFGGSLNEAVIKVGIAIDKLHEIDNRLLETLYGLGVEVHFIDQTKPGFAKTLNKFGTFELYDDIRFDYFLWLDADIVVFQDPLVHLRRHKYPGEIQCVPDVYSYMRRYPLINSTSAVWNPRLPAFSMLGDVNEPAPHGTCNTGMLFFDSLSLKTFMKGYHAIQRYETYQLGDPEFPYLDILYYYRRDRFIDSLYFIYIVNTLNIEVSILPHSMNYMAYFEGELMDHIGPTEVVMGHFLSDTTLYCLSTPVADSPGTKECTCVYENKHLEEQSPVVKYVNQLISPHICMVITGDWPLPTQVNISTTSSNYRPLSLTRGEVPLEQYKVNPETLEPSLELSDGTLFPFVCELKWPTSYSHVLRVDHLNNVIPLDTHLSCVPRESSVRNVTLRVEYSVSRASCGEVLDSPLFSGALKRSLCIKELASMVDQISSIELFSGSVSVDSDGSEAEVGIATVLQVNYDTTDNDLIRDTYLGTIPMRLTVKLTAVEHSTVVEADGTVMVKATSVPSYLRGLSLFTLGVESLKPQGMLSYSKNLLHGSRSIALESQLQLSIFLNTHHIGTSSHLIGGGMVVVVCCQSQKGADTVKSLIEQWRGDTLVIFMVRTLIPIFVESSKSSSNLFDISVGMNQWCAERHGNTLLPPLKCVIVSSVGTESWRLPYLFAEGSVSAVYMDHAPQYEEYLTSIRLWNKRLKKGGLLMGSQYTHARPDRISKTALVLQSSVQLTSTQARNDAIIAGRRHDVGAAVEAFTSEVLQNVLMTYLERDEKYCWHDFGESDASSLREYYFRHCSPAWYYFKA